MLPALRPRRAWSAGCASGEEAYTLALIAPELEILATDVHEPVLRRARAAVYPESSFAELPERLRAGMRRRRVSRAGSRSAATTCATSRRDGPFDLILCRNSAFTYFADDVQAQVLERLLGVLRPGGALVVGLHERLPLEPWPGARASTGSRTARARSTSAVASGVVGRQARVGEQVPVAGIQEELRALDRTRDVDVAELVVLHHVDLQRHGLRPRAAEVLQRDGRVHEHGGARAGPRHRQLLRRHHAEREPGVDEVGAERGDGGLAALDDRRRSRPARRRPSRRSACSKVLPS